MISLPANSETSLDVLTQLDRNYYYRVRAFNSYGPSDYTSSGAIYVPSEPVYKVAGFDQIFGTKVYNASRRAQLTTMPEDGTIQKISMYHGPGGGSLLYAIYADDGGKPGTRLAVTATTPASGTTGWQEAALTEPLFVAAHTNIWIAWVYEYAPEIRYTDGSPGRASSSDTYAQGMPPSFGASNVADYKYSIHAIYQAVITNPVPSAPTHLAAVYTESVPSVTLNWTDNATTEENYILERSVNGGSFTMLVTLSANTMSFTDHTILHNNIYVYRVFAQNDNGNSAYSNSVQLNTTYVAPGPPASPSGINLVYDENAPSITLGWQDNANDEDNYIIRRSINGGAFSLLATLAANQTHHTDYNIAYGNTCQYEIVAVNTFGNSDTLRSGIQEATLPDPPLAPANVQLSTGSGYSVIINWLDVSQNETGYELERKKNSEDYELIETLPVNSTSATDFVPELDAYYTYRVRAINAYGNSAYATSTLMYMASVLPERIVGYDEVFGTSLYNNYRRAQMVTMPEGGYVHTLAMYHTGGNGNMMLAVYDSDGNKPLNRIAVTPVTRVNSSAGWQEIELEEPVFVTANENIWLSWIFESSPGIRYTTGGPGRAHSNTTWSSGMPSNFGSSSIDNYRYSIYAKYFPGVSVPPPTAPSNLTYLYDESQPAVYLNWTENASDEAGVVVERSVNGGSFSMLASLSVDANSFTDYSIVHNAIYRYRIYVHNTHGISAYSNLISVDTELALPPSAPSNLTASFQAISGSVLLNWTDNADNEDTFIIERRISGGTFAQLVVLTANSVSYTNDTIAFNQNYEYRIRAHNTVGYSAYSALASVNTEYTPPSPPVAPADLNISYNSLVPQMSLSWSDVSDNEQGFTLERKTNGGAYIGIASLPANTESYTDNTPGYGNSYQYRIRAFNTAGNSAYIESTPVLASDPEIAPLAPSSLTADYNDDGPSIRLSWTDNSIFEDGFVLERNLNSGGFSTLVNLAVNETEYEDFALGYNQDISYRVYSYNSFGNSAPSNLVSLFTTEPNTDPITVGYPDVFSIPVFTAYRRAQQVTVPSDGTIESISMYLNPVSSGNYIYGVYSDNGGSPDQLLATTAISPKNNSASWNTASLTSPLEVRAGQRVWLAWCFDHGTEIFYTSGTPGRAHSGKYWSGSLPVDFGSSTFSNYIYSIYMTMYPQGTKEAGSKMDGEFTNKAILQVHPNPLKGNTLHYFIDKLPVGGEYTLEVRDLTGRLLMNEQVWLEPEQQNDLQFYQSIEEGVLILRIFNQDEQFMERISVHP